MGHLDVQRVSQVLPDGRVLFADVSSRAGDGAKTALVGANGAGKTTLLCILAGDTAPSEGTVVREGGVGGLRQFVGAVRDDTTVRDLLVSLAPPAVRAAGEGLEAAELVMHEAPGPVWDDGRVPRAR